MTFCVLVSFTKELTHEKVSSHLEKQGRKEQ